MNAGDLMMTNCAAGIFETAHRSYEQRKPSIYLKPNDYVIVLKNGHDIGLNQYAQPYSVMVLSRLGSGYVAYDVLRELEA